MLENLTKFQDRVFQCMQCGFCMYFCPHYDLSKQIAAHKMSAIADAGAAIVATACPGCMIQLLDHTRQAQLPQRVMHVMELLRADQA
jgi:Fe-S oxidoreductase